MEELCPGDPAQGPTPPKHINRLDLLLSSQYTEVASRRMVKCSLWEPSLVPAKSFT